MPKQIKLSLHRYKHITNNNKKAYYKKKNNRKAIKITQNDPTKQLILQPAPRPSHFPTVHYVNHLQRNPPKTTTYLHLVLFRCWINLKNGNLVILTISRPFLIDLKT